MDEYSSFGSGLVVLPTADRVLKVSPKRGPGDRKGKNSKQGKKKGSLNVPPGEHSKGTVGQQEEEAEAKGTGIDIVI